MRNTSLTIFLAFILAALSIPVAKTMADTFYPMLAGGMYMTGILDTGTITSTTLNANFQNTVSGAFSGVRFNSPVTQVNGNLTLHVYCTASSGTPDQTVAIIMNGPTGAMDDDRPSTNAVAATSTVTDASNCGTGKYLDYNFTNVSLVTGTTTFAGVINMEANPAVDNFAIETRGPLDAYLGANASYPIFISSNTTNGFTSDPTGGSLAPMVIKFNDGTIMGFPFVTTANHANNTNYRGIRVNYDGDVTVGAIQTVGITSGQFTIGIYQGATTIVEKIADLAVRNNTAALTIEPTTLTHGLDYDVLFKPVGNTTAGTIYNMGNSPIPDDVQAAQSNFSSVDGTTLGSLTEFATSTMTSALWLITNPAQSGGGGSTNFGLQVTGSLNVTGSLEMKGN